MTCTGMTERTHCSGPGFWGGWMSHIRAVYPGQKQHVWELVSQELTPSWSPGCVLSTLPPGASQASSCTLLILLIPISGCKGWKELQSHLVYFSHGFFIFILLIFWLAHRELGFIQSFSYIYMHVFSKYVKYISVIYLYIYLFSSSWSTAFSDREVQAGCDSSWVSLFLSHLYR